MNQERNFTSAQNRNVRAVAALLELLLFPAVRGIGEFFLEFVNPSCRIDELHFARVEGMTNAANIDFEFRLCRPRGKFITATAGYLGFNVLWMNVLLHNFLSIRSNKPPSYCTKTGKK
jgi:hypothetical protein